MKTNWIIFAMCMAYAKVRGASNPEIGYEYDGLYFYGKFCPDHAKELVDVIYPSN
jgi:hypothetical protein